MSKMMVALAEWQKQNKDAINGLDSNRKSAVVKALEFLNAKYSIEQMPLFEIEKEEVEDEFDFEENIEFSEDIDLGDIELEDFEIDDDLDFGDLELSDIEDFDTEEEQETFKVGDYVESKSKSDERIITQISNWKGGEKNYLTQNPKYSKEEILEINDLKKLGKIRLKQIYEYNSDRIFKDYDSFNDFLINRQYPTTSRKFTFEFQWSNGVSAVVRMFIGMKPNEWNPENKSLEDYFVDTLIRAVVTKKPIEFMNQSYYLPMADFDDEPEVVPFNSNTDTWENSYYKLSLSEFRTI
jgi:hypothetical protein